MIEVRALSQSFKGKEILKDVSFTLDHGVYGLLGPNGAGKTTLIRCLTGIYPVQKCCIQMNGQDAVGSRKFARALGYLPQAFGLYPGMTVEEMLRCFADMKRIPPKQQKAEIESWLEAVGLSEHKGDRIRTLSGGMIRRIGIVQALLGSPELVILDEPTAGLDPEERVRFKNLIAGLSRDKTILLSTHIVEDVGALCDQILLLLNGTIAVCGTPDEIASLGRGRVYSVPPEREAELIAPYFISQRNDTNMRVLSDLPQPGVLQEPTVEDGYLCCVKGYL